MRLIFQQRGSQRSECGQTRSAAPVSYASNMIDIDKSSATENAIIVYVMDEEIRPACDNYQLQTEKDFK